MGAQGAVGSLAMETHKAQPEMGPRWRSVTARCHSSVSSCWAGPAGKRREQLALGGEAMAQVTEAVKQEELAHFSLFCLQAGPLCVAECSASPTLS